MPAFWHVSKSALRVVMVRFSRSSARNNPRRRGSSTFLATLEASSVVWACGTCFLVPLESAFVTLETRSRSKCLLTRKISFARLCLSTGSSHKSKASSAPISKGWFSIHLKPWRRFGDVPFSLRAQTSRMSSNALPTTVTFLPGASVKNPSTAVRIFGLVQKSLALKYSPPQSMQRARRSSSTIQRLPERCVVTTMKWELCSGGVGGVGGAAFFGWLWRSH
mmetsp:Transcript_2683/g.7778  ORF Transcript_2683/g.7778 Transcript_2683/m.7778 type:complete len:221 (+) Transcript_2683:299-961(+)